MLMNTLSKFLNAKIGVFVLLAISFGLIYNPLTKFPVTFCVIIVFIFLSTYLQDGNFKALNFNRLNLKTVGLILLLYVFLEVTADFVIQPLITKIFNEPADYSSFKFIEGDTPNYLKYLIFMWISAAFGEELLFRAFVFSQLKKIIGEQKIVIVLLSTVLFSLPHLYQGTAGLVITFLFGIFFGLIYLKFKNIWINIIVHGLIDTVFLTLSYYGLLSFYS
ncbi:hypothetical protein FSS13T_08000 [Flavobacterium saliperosum S13]|uniref:CAAX prenyl protease 2/Lysostaphin resistance protein A-like domain-containing protein n=2 Tax=Flavobacterium saliperosum TaxID=329186 RepID=A0A1G4W159_9FLAO|nr:type II CAAX endopeptidase family protein [Flavobacterium saliperosum]ESU27536.1 hypothetical protein FSS13T_08000 [Flavobacterium saliperosum S13]SCX15119.1 hypothetical protein SAMN02927925_02189 [Flavobacterium saliperosum]